MPGLKPTTGLPELPGLFGFLLELATDAHRVGQPAAKLPGSPGDHPAIADWPAKPRRLPRRLKIGHRPRPSAAHVLRCWFRILL